MGASKNWGGGGGPVLGGALWEGSYHHIGAHTAVFWAYGKFTMDDGRVIDILRKSPGLEPEGEG